MYVLIYDPFSFTSPTINTVFCLLDALLLNIKTNVLFETDSVSVMAAL